MSHIHEDLDLTFSDLISIVTMIGKKGFSALEKVDGQNLFVTFNNGEIRAARNLGDLRSGGVTESEFIDRYKDHPARVPFQEGLIAAKRILSADRRSFTHAGRQIWANIEILHTEYPNLIHYDHNSLIIHSLLSSNHEKCDPTKILNYAFGDYEFGDITNKWKMFLGLHHVLEETDTTETVEKIEKQMTSESLLRTNTLREYAELRIRRDLEKRFSTKGPQIDELAAKISGRSSTHLNDIKKKFSSFSQKKVSEVGTEKGIPKVIREAMCDLETILCDFSGKVLVTVGSNLVSDHESEIKRIKSLLAESMSTISSGNDSLRKAEMSRHLSRISDINNSVTSLEGLVFDYPLNSGKQYKITGAFSVINAIVGMTRYPGR